MNEGHSAERGATDEPMVTLRMPLSNWDGIVNGIEKWTGRGAWDDVEILEDIELLEGDPRAIWWLNNYYGDPRDD